MPQADTAIITATQMFQSMVTSPEPKLSEAYVATKTQMFKGITMKEMGKL
jgi:hypothetical protein